MNVLKVVLVISLHFQFVLPRRRPLNNEAEDSSGESFENLLYFQDCTKKKDQPSEPKAIPFTGPQIIVKEVQPQCQQCPAVCYSCCFNPPSPMNQNSGFNSPNIMASSFDQNSALSAHQSSANPSFGNIGLGSPSFRSHGGIAPVNSISPINNHESSLPNSPYTQQKNSENTPFFRGQVIKKKKLKPLIPYGFRRSGGPLKGLIEKDDDIKKILRELVKTTIQKVDTLEKERKNENDAEFPSSEVIVVQDGEEGNMNNNGNENEE